MIVATAGLFGKRQFDAAMPNFRYHPKKVSRLPLEAEAQFVADHHWSDDWHDPKAVYASGKSDVALYKSICLHCGLWRIGVDRA